MVALAHHSDPMFTRAGTCAPDGFQRPSVEGLLFSDPAFDTAFISYARLRRGELVMDDDSGGLGLCVMCCVFV